MKWQENKKCGILMPLFSLPSEYGIGSLGKPSMNFVDFLAQSRQGFWQLLPLNPLTCGDSPYQSPYSMAGNPYFIDLEQLYESKLITYAELTAQIRPKGTDIDYGDLFINRTAILKTAFSRFKEQTQLQEFIDKNRKRLFCYALYMSIKESKGYCAWTDWEKELRDYSKALAKAESYATNMRFWYFTQYLFEQQYQRLKQYAKEKNVAIIGDIPFYVAYDSADCWSCSQLFCLDEDGGMRLSAGCPPDGFTPDGQQWCTPVYNKEQLKCEGYDWWLKRFDYCLEMYDYLRIDHFCGLVKYYAYPAQEKTTKNGKWYTSFGDELLGALSQKYPDMPFIAEDLGYAEQNADHLVKKYEVSSMKLLQSAFYDCDSTHLPSRFTTENCVVYTGNHDSQTTVSWCKGLCRQMKKRVIKEFKPQKGESLPTAMLRAALESKAKLAVIPLQDYLGLNDKARINDPSKTSLNWRWRLLELPDNDVREKIAALAEKCNRA